MSQNNITSISQFQQKSTEVAVTLDVYPQKSHLTLSNISHYTHSIN